MNGKIEVELQNSMGSDFSIANAAWNSTFDKSKRDARYDDKQKIEELVRRMAKEGHSVPFESVILQFWIRMPIFTDRQHITHRIASHSGLSGRYRTMPTDWYSAPDDVLEIASKLKPDLGVVLKQHFDIVCARSQEFYQSWLADFKEAEKAGKISNQEYKRAREVLRGVLPVAGMTERTSIMNLRSFANFIRLRRSEHAQKEIYEVADKMLNLVKEVNICPVAIEALESVGWRI